MGNKLSYSQLTKYMFCPTSWKYHYKERIREHKMHAALLFGSAVDNASQVMLKTRELAPTLIEWKEQWSRQMVDGVMTELATSTKLVYANSDFDVDLLTPENWEILATTYDLIDVEATLKRIYSNKDYIGWDFLPDNEKRILNHANWFCLLRKGETMLTAFHKKVMPNIVEVLSIQEQAVLDNGQGDEIVGYVDFVVKWKGMDKPVILDLKTSARDYDKDAVVTSPQLSLYLHALSAKYGNTRSAGFIVLKKQLNKNKTKICGSCGHDGSGKTHKTCPNIISVDVDATPGRCDGAWLTNVRLEADVQILINNIPNRLEEIVLDNFDLINTSIKNDVFHRNFSSCVDPKRGKCAYYNLCYHNKLDGLFKKEDS